MWFSLWDDDDEDDLLYPLHLYSFGDGLDLKPADVKNLVKQIKRDFGIRNRETAILRIRELFGAAGLTAQTPPFFSESENSEDAAPAQDIARGLRILYASMAALAVTGSVDAGYLAKIEVMPTLIRLNKLIRDTFPHENSDWKVFADAFLMEEELAGINNEKGRRILAKFVGYLKTKTGSPWNNVAFHPPLL